MLTAGLLLAAVALGAAPAAAGNCTLVFRSHLRHGTVRLCGRQNGGQFGQWFEATLAPGATYSRPCVTTQPGMSYETYISVRGLASCPWDACNPNTGSCHSYPYLLGQGVSPSNGYWYGSIGPNYDGAIGYQLPYNAPNVSYGVSLSAFSYTRANPWKATCGETAGTTFCNPNVPAAGFPNSGVVAAGPPNDQGTLTIDLTESA